MAKKKDKVQKVEQEHRMKTRMEAIYQCVLFVDWQKVRKVMKALKWTWVTTNDEVPSVDDLKNEAIVLLEECFDDVDNHNGDILERTIMFSRGGVFGKVYIENGEVVEVSCGFILDSHSVEMSE